MINLRFINRFFHLVNICFGVNEIMMIIKPFFSLAFHLYANKSFLNSNQLSLTVYHSLFINVLT